MIASIGIIAAIVFMSWSIYKGLNPVISAVAAVFIIMLTGQLPVHETWDTAMSTVSMVLGILAPILAFGGILGVFYAESGAAASLGRLIMLPARNIQSPTMRRVAILTIFLIVRAVIGLSGIDANALLVPFVSLSLAIFKEFNLPTKYIPCLNIVSTSVANVVPAAPNLYNILMEEVVPGYSASGAIVIRIVLVLLFIVGIVFILNRNMAKDIEKGEHFVQGPVSVPEFNESRKNPHWVITLIPILVIFLTYNFTSLEAWSSLLLGVIVAFILFGPYVPQKEGKGRFASALDSANKGVWIIPLQMMLVMIASQVMTLSSGLENITNALLATSLPTAFVLLLIALLLMGFGGSAASMTIGALCASTFIPLGLSGMACGVIAIWSSTVLDTLPINTAILLNCDMVGTTMKEAYPSIFKTSVVLTFGLSVLVTVLAMLNIF